VDDPDETVEVSEEVTGGLAEIFALRVRGTPMIDALVNDGDLVLMRATDKSLEQLLDDLANRSGLLGLSGYNDLRDIEEDAARGGPVSQQAIDVVKNHAGAIELLFTDVVMAGMSGRAAMLSKPGITRVQISDRGIT